MRRTRFLLATALTLGFLAPAFAQEQTATLQVESGNAMISVDGGEFVSAPSGTPVPPGARVMVTEGGRASLSYPNGCSQALGSAGVFSVSGSCVAGSGTQQANAGGGSGSAGGAAGGGFGAAAGTLGVVGGVVAGFAAGMETQDDVPIDETAVSR